MVSELVKIAPPEFDVEIELRYATSNNFTGRPVYANPHCYLHADAAKCLQKLISLAGSAGYKIKIFDAYRPQEAQEKLWAHTPDPDFLANPASGSPHSRGVALDLTLVDASGKELNMGTEFDAFTPKSYHANLEITAAAQTNRAILLGLMTASGWDFYSHEWWHYQLFNPRSYRLLTDRESGTRMM